MEISRSCRTVVKDRCFLFEAKETAGTYAETAFFHKKTQSLLLIDAVLKVPESPPEILTSYGCLSALESLS